MLSLMKYSLSVINPSKSEGLSNSVEQAKTLAKKICGQETANLPFIDQKIGKWEPEPFRYVAVNAGFKIFIPVPPKTSLPITTPKITATVSIHNGISTGTINGTNIPVTK